MALQLTPMVGTTAFPDRMGDYYPGFLEEGRIVQGHNVSGPMNPEVIAAVNRDGADLRWRVLFHEALQSNYQFQRGLIDVSQLELGRSPESEDSTPWLGMASSDWVDQPFHVAMVQGLCGRRLSEEEQSRFEYGLALIKTAVALVYTVRLCHQLKLVAVTDSSSHHELLARTCERDHIELPNYCVKRRGY